MSGATEPGQLVPVAFAMRENASPGSGRRGTGTVTGAVFDRCALGTYLVADLATIADGDAAAIVGAAVDGGATAVQIRGKDLSDDALLRVVRDCAERVAGRAMLLVDDRVGVFLAARAAGVLVDGVHVGQRDEPVVRVRERVGPDAVIGLSASTDAEIDTALALPAGTVDYLGVGAVRATPTKRDAPDPIGWAGFARAARRACGLPCVAIGGVGPGDAEAAAGAGAAGLAVVRAICCAQDPAAAARRLRDEWRQARVAERVPNVLSIAGSDPSGGAGIQADLKAIQATGGYGMAVVTALTAQNTRGVVSVHAVPHEVVTQQLSAVVDDIRIDAIKIGMLGSGAVASAVAGWVESLEPRPVLVLDPVMVATSGDRLLDPDAERALLRIVGLADVVTPNLPELAALAGEPVAGRWHDALTQARGLAVRHGTLVLVKGGHLGGPACPDALVGASGVVAQFDGARIATSSTHGTGCTLSSALASIHGRRMRTPAEHPIDDAADWAWSARLARDWTRGAIAAAGALEVGSPGGNGPLDHGFALRAGERAPRRAAELDAWWEDIAGLRDGIMADDFLRSLGDGTLAHERFRTYLTQDAVYLHHYSSALSRAAELAPSIGERDFWAASSRSCLETEMALHRAHGIDPNAKPSRQTAAYLAFLSEAAEAGDYGVLIAAVLPCFWIYDDVGRRLAARNRDGHPFGDWLDTYGDPVFSAATAQAREFVQCAARRASPEALARMHRVFEGAALLEREFFAQA